MLFANSYGSPRASLDSAPDAAWLDLVDPTEQERSAAERVAGFTLPTRENIGEIENSSRVSTHAGVLYLNSPIAYRDRDGRSTITSAGFVLSEHKLVTIRFAEMPLFDAVAEQFGQLRGATGAEAFAQIIEALVDRLADALEHAGAELDSLSKHTFSDGKPAGYEKPRGRNGDQRRTLTRVGQVSDAISNFRDTLLGLGRIVAYTQQADVPWLPPSIRARLAAARQDIASLNDYDQQLSARIGFLLDAVLGFISIEQNDTFRVLTVVSIVGIPPTFVVGLYGMNFKNMPEYNWAWGYEWGWAMIALSILVPLIWVRLKGWI